MPRNHSAAPMQSTLPAETRTLPTLVIRPERGLIGRELQDLWQFRELLVFFIWRDLKIRYKQTALGAAWAIIQPVTTVLLFSVIFGHFAGLPSDGVPYVVYAYAALLPWNLFSGAINRSGTSLVSSSNLISKVYFPRLLVPLSAALGAAVDFAISFGVFIVLLIAYKQPLLPSLLTFPFWAMWILILGLSVGLGLSALNVRYRDVTYLIGFMLQLWMYASPIAYSGSVVPERWRALYSLNPLVGMVQGFRWASFGTAGELGIPWIPAVTITLILFVASLAYFRAVERSFADII